MEPEFSDVKQFIWDGSGDADRFVRQCKDRFVANFNASERPTEWMHILAVRRTFMAITANAQFFAGPRSLPPGYEISLGRNPARLHAHDGLCLEMASCPENRATAQKRVTI